MPALLAKTLNLTIDQQSWASAPTQYQHPIPPQFLARQSTTNIDFLRALIWTGTVAVPPTLTEWSLAIRWAELRYLNAADHSLTELRLHPAMADLETHYLASLSDDWGVGIALEWITSNLDIVSVGHGRFWCDYLVKKEKSATYRREPGKRGPAKCPDFVAFDSAGLMYLIECKGTTTNSDYTTDQFNASAFDQKINVEFDDEAKVGQRLATGVYIARYDSSEDSRLKIADPPPRKQRERVCFVSATAPQMTRAIKADTIARGLLAAGFVPEARLLMPGNKDQRWNPRSESQEIFYAHDVEWQGRVERFELSIPLRIEDREYSVVTARDGVSTRILSTLRQLGGDDHGIDALIDGAQTQLRPSHHHTTAEGSEGLYASVQHGDLTIRDISLTPE